MQTHKKVNNELAPFAGVIERPEHFKKKHTNMYNVILITVR